ncbi:hypothetical protein BGX26_010383 [Mortierella sp. AD094]|nr:hypothetical protein BGX26_010383 [Mortierella sp. AD094]
MLVHWNFFTFNVILAVFNALLIAALDATLAIYSTIGGEYANATRWIRQGGYLEMFKILQHSRKNVPKLASRAMSFTPLASIAAVFIDKIATFSIHQATALNKHSRLEMVTSPHVIFPTVSTTFQRWSTSVRYGGNITDAVVRLINNTTNIPDFKKECLYTPRTFDYDIGCDQVDLVLSYMDTPPLVRTNESCATISILATGSAQPFYELASRATLSKGRYSINLPAISGSSIVVNELSSDVWYTYNQTRCFNEGPEAYTVLFPHDGLTSAPGTSITKCVFPNGIVSVLSTSSIRFMSTSFQQFQNVSAAILSEHDELTQAMEVAMDRSAKDPIPAVLAEIKIVDNSIDMLMCYSANSTEISTLVQMCEYRTVQLIVTTKQDINPIIYHARGSSPLSSGFIYNLVTRITHIPTVFNGTQVPTLPISFRVLKSSTLELSHYMTALGQNVYVDWEQQRLFVMFDTWDILEGLNVPLWLMVLFGAIMIACLVLWIHVWLKFKKHRGSLYHNITQQVSDRVDCKAPMLMPFKTDTKKLGGFPILSGEPRKKNDASTSITLLKLSLVNLEGILSDISLLNTRESNV